MSLTKDEWTLYVAEAFQVPPTMLDPSYDGPVPPALQNIDPRGSE